MLYGILFPNMEIICAKQNHELHSSIDLLTTCSSVSGNAFFILFVQDENISTLAHYQTHFCTVREKNWNNLITLCENVYNLHF